MVDDNYNEGTIRDHLASNLGLIESGLTLIEKEHHLENLVGANGSVDILAKDRFNNFVVIEIKRSQQASRQTIQELLKYIALLKQNYHARDSDIRCIIVSTHWGELLVPFSELRYQTTLDVKGLKLTIDNKFKPIQAEVIQPLDVSSLQRRFACTYWLDLYLTEDNRTAAIPVLQRKCQQFGLSDFVILCMDALNGPERGVVYPFATCFAFQSQANETYIELLGESEHLDMNADEFETTKEFESYLENVLLLELLGGRYSDSGEIGSPRKLDAELARKNWRVGNVYKHGAFASDPRYNDDFLLSELKGFDGNNPNKFLNFCESNHRDRLAEIKEKCQVTLQHNRNWQEHIGQVFDYLQNLNSPYRLIVYIYSPSSVFDSIIRTLAGAAYDYLPMYQIFADFTTKDELMVFDGYLTWNGKDTDEHRIIDFFKDERKVFMTKFIDTMMGYHDAKIIKLFQLMYRHRLAQYKHNEPVADYAFTFKNSVIKQADLGAKSIKQWIADNRELQYFLLKMAELEVYGYR